MRKTDPAGMDSEVYLKQLLERSKVELNRVPGVKTVLVVLSAKALTYDIDALRMKVMQAYPDSAVFFRNTSGRMIGIHSPQKVDLLIDLTGPGQRQPFFYAKKLKGSARFAVGRNAGLFRKKVYDRVFDEKGEHQGSLPRDMIDRERFVQKQVLALAGVADVPAADATPDLGKKIALTLPKMNG